MGNCHIIKLTAARPVKKERLNQAYSEILLCLGQNKVQMPFENIRQLAYHHMLLCQALSYFFSFYFSLALA
jgi:hypothetical protein